MADKTILGPTTQTPRGFDLIKFKDSYGVEFSLQCSSVFSVGSDEAYDNPENGLDFPGSSFIWIGGGERMHLNQVQVKALIGHLSDWLQTGRL